MPETAIRLTELKRWTLVAKEGVDGTPAELVDYHEDPNGGVVFFAAVKDASLFLEDRTQHGRRDRAEELLTAFKAFINAECFRYTEPSADLRWALHAIAKYEGREDTETYPQPDPQTDKRCELKSCLLPRGHSGNHVVQDRYADGVLQDGTKPERMR